MVDRDQTDSRSTRGALTTGAAIVTAALASMTFGSGKDTREAELEALANPVPPIAGKAVPGADPENVVPGDSPETAETSPVSEVHTQTMRLTDVKERVFKEILKFEGGPQNDPDDPGNRNGSYTNLGVTQDVYDNWRAAHGLPSRSTLQVTRDEAKQIFIEQYWDAIQCDEICRTADPGLAMLLVDMAFNMGPSRTAKFLQRAIREQEIEKGIAREDLISVDGSIGPQTIGRLAAADSDVLRARVHQMRMSYYNNLGQSEKFQKYRNGWINRGNHCIEVADELANFGVGSQASSSVQSSNQPKPEPVERVNVAEELQESLQTLQSLVDSGRILKRSTGSVEEVKALQTILNYFIPDSKISVDGNFGPTTERTLKECQRALGLTRNNVDGIFGPTTFGLMRDRITGAQR